MERGAVARRHVRPQAPLTRDDGKPLPFDKPRGPFAKTGNLMKSPWKFKKHGESGLGGERALPARRPAGRRPVRHQLAPRHQPRPRRRRCSSSTPAATPSSAPAWAPGSAYGLGTENRQPAGVRHDLPDAGARRRQQLELAPSCRRPTRGRPSAHAGIPARAGDASGTSPTAACSATNSGGSSTCWPRLNRDAPRQTGPDRDLEGRIASFELAFRMQMSMPEVRGRLAGVGSDAEALRPRRPGDGGLRPAVPAWPAASSESRRPLRPGDPQRLQGPVGPAQRPLRSDTRRTPAKSTCPIAGLLTDLESRGLLEATRSSCGEVNSAGPRRSKGNDGRDHNPEGFTMWMAGGGVKGECRYGETDDYGYFAVREQGPHPRPARHAPAPPGPRPRALDLPLRWPRLPPH